MLDHYMSLLITSIASIILLVIAWEIIQLLRAKPPTNVHLVVMGKDSSSTYEQKIPRIIWSYWHDPIAPDFIQSCKRNWQQFAPDHEVRMLSRESMGEWIKSDELLNNFDSLPAYRQADWLRLQLLKLYGGIWIDASTVLTQDLAWVHDHQVQHKSEYVGFYLRGYTTNIKQPIVENWFMAAIPNSQYITDVAQEFDRALTMKEKPYLDELRNQQKLERIAQGMESSVQQYLIMHVATAVVLDKNSSYRLVLICAEDSALAFHSALRWRKKHLYVKLALLPQPKQLPCIIKLRGSDRRIIEKGLAKNWLIKNSFLANFLNHLFEQ
jgi:hypothetical protein